MVLYKNETWTINKKEKDMLEAIEMWCMGNLVEKKN